MTAKPTAKYLKDYQSAPFQIPTIELFFNLDDEATLVRSKLNIKRQAPSESDLVLNSQVKEVAEIKLDGRTLESSEFKVLDETLVIYSVPGDFELEIECTVDPANNKALEGLYKSSGVFCTQCEAEGFRKITPFLDRPDVLSVFTVTIFADKATYPFLLANGNDIESGEWQEDDRTTHWVKWHDPYPKPCYLFALVAGDFDLLRDKFETQSGREVSLELFVDKGNVHLAHHAMSSLIKSMKWDEDKYGLEYDLDKYMIVAVDFFNMGAMENKGLNVFNSKYVLADEATATDRDYHGVEAVIAHEYFHNWTGNRVTCRDWFQLSLKEGLTVFRDQQFSADMGSEVLERISHANVMRTMQFAEDAGPMAHPIRPEKVIEMNNFYTVTVYDKGAEVIRMMHSLLGENGFRQGMDLYFKRHDGHAVTCDDFVSAMADANNYNLDKFRNWYRQAGTPVVKVTEEVTANSIIVHFNQTIPTRPEGEDVLALVIPIKYQVLDASSGKELERGVWEFSEKQQSFELSYSQPVQLVLFENFSAPVKVVREQSLQDLAFIATYASDPFCRWDAIQQLWNQIIQSGELESNVLITLFESVISESGLSPAIKAQLLAPPSFDALAQAQCEIKVDVLLDNKSQLFSKVALALAEGLKKELQQLSNIENGYEAERVGQRSYKTVLLAYLAQTKDESVFNLVEACYDNASNMTERMAALQAARDCDLALFDKLNKDLDATFSGNVLVLDKILMNVAKVESPDVYKMMAQWAQHKDFNEQNPNRLRSLYGAFVMANPKIFHAVDGSGYEFLTQLLIKVDEFNPQVASRMISPLLNFKRFETSRRQLMLQQLELLSKQKLSADLYEKVSAALQ